MALSLVQSKGVANSNTSGTVAFTSNVTTGNLLLVLYGGYNDIINLPTDSQGNTWVEIMPGLTGAGSSKIVAFGAVAKSTGANTVSYSGAPSANEACIFLEEWSGVAGLAFVGFQTQIANSSTCTNAYMPLTSAAGTAVMWALQVTDTVTMSVSPGTERQTVSLSSGAWGAVADASLAVQSSFNNFSVTWTASSGSKNGVNGMLFLFPAPSSTVANSSYAS